LIQKVKGFSGTWFSDIFSFWRVATCAFCGERQVGLLGLGSLLAWLKLG